MLAPSKVGWRQQIQQTIDYYSGPFYRDLETFSLSILKRFLQRSIFFFQNTLQTFRSFPIFLLYYFPISLQQLITDGYPKSFRLNRLFSLENNKHTWKNLHLFSVVWGPRKQIWTKIRKWGKKLESVRRSVEFSDLSEIHLKDIKKYDAINCVKIG